MRDWPLLLLLLLLSLLQSAHAQAQDSETPGLRVRYSQLGAAFPPHGDSILEGDMDAITAIRARPENPDNARIVNGQDVVLVNFSEVVRIEFATASGEAFCTGVLLSPDTLLTAGHCGCGSNYRAEIQIRHSLTTAPALFVDVPVLGDPILFPNYNCGGSPGRSPGRDLALLRVTLPGFEDGVATFPLEMPGAQQSVLFSFPVIRPAALVMANRELRSLYVVGFGALADGSLATNLQAANIGIISRHCQRGTVLRSVCAMFREFSLGRSSLDPNPPDSCGGDSGGPAYRMDADLTLDADALPNGISKRTLVGIVSRALEGAFHPFTGFCGGGGIYTAVGTRPVLNWLRSNNVDFAYDANPVFQKEEATNEQE